MKYYGYVFVRENELMHHGIKGQKWGVRRFQNEDGTWTDQGRRRYSQFFSNEDTYNRIKSLRNSERMKYMSDRQKQSLLKAEAYWKAKAEGTTPIAKRGVIRRQADRYRSYSLESRATQAAAMNLVSNLGGFSAKASLFGPAAAVGQTFSNTVLGTAGGLALAELENKMFGHF